MKICNTCHKECGVYWITEEKYAPHSRSDLAYTWNKRICVSDCCEDYFTEENDIYMCKCGNEMEISGDADIEWHVCQLCKRRGNWERVDPEIYWEMETIKL